MFVKILRREQLLQAGAVGVERGAAGGLPGGDMGLDTGDDAKCFHLEKIWLGDVEPVNGRALSCEDVGLDLKVSEQSQAFAGPLWWQDGLGLSRGARRQGNHLGSYYDSSLGEQLGQAVGMVGSRGCQRPVALCQSVCGHTCSHSGI